MMIDFVEDENSSIVDELCDVELVKLLGERIDKVLTDSERMVVERRFGFYNGRCMKLEEIGQELGLTRERIRQIEQKAIKKLTPKCKDLKDYCK